MVSEDLGENTDGHQCQGHRPLILHSTHEGKRALTADVRKPSLLPCIFRKNAECLTEALYHPFLARLQLVGFAACAIK